MKDYNSWFTVFALAMTTHVVLLLSKYYPESGAGMRNWVFCIVLLCVAFFATTVFAQNLFGSPAAAPEPKGVGKPLSPEDFDKAAKQLSDQTNSNLQAQVKQQQAKTSNTPVIGGDETPAAPSAAAPTTSPTAENPAEKPPTNNLPLAGPPGPPTQQPSTQPPINPIPGSTATPPSEGNMPPLGAAPPPMSKQAEPQPYTGFTPPKSNKGTQGTGTPIKSTGESGGGWNVQY